MRRRWLGACLLVLMLAPGGLVGQTTSLEERYTAGASALQSGRVFDALDLLGAVASESPRYRDVQMLLGQACLLAGLHRQAKQHFQAAVDAEPTNGQAAFFLGFSLYRSARYFEAAEVLERAAGLAGQNPLPFAYRGLALLELGRLDEARRDIATALNMAPGEPTARTAAAELDLLESRYAAAEQRLRELVAEGPPSDEVQILLARVLLESGRAGEAIPVLEPLIAASPPRSDLLYLLGQAQLRSGATDVGRKTLIRFRERKTREERIRLLEATVSTDPEDTASRVELTTLLVEDGLAQAALPHLAELQKRLPGDPRVRDLAQRIARQRERR